MRKRWNMIAARAVSVILCAAMCMGLSACAGGRDADVKLRSGATFTVAVAQSPDTLNPVTSAGGITEEFFLLCYDPLWRIGADGRPEACLAEDWSLSSDGLTWTIRLRHDGVFSDGKPVTSKDVLFSYELMRHDSAYADYFEGITALRAPDEYTLVISTQYVKSDMTYNPTPILPQHLWKDYEFTPGQFDNAAMIGSGPFVYDADASGADGWLFRAREEHFGEEVGVAAVFFSYYGTVTGAARALAAGEADASFGLTDVQLTTLEGVPGVELLEAMLPGAECRALVFNTREGDVFADAGLRQLMEYCADRAWFLSMSSGGTGREGSSFASPGTDYFTEVSGLRGYDPDRARLGLAAAGYVDTDNDGILEYGLRGRELRLKLYTSDADEWASTAATILSAELEELGISVDWRKTEAAITEVCTAKSEWDMCLTSWTGSPSAAVAAGSFQSRIGGLSGWDDPTFRLGLEELRSAGDETSVKGCAQRLQQVVYDACPVVVLSYSADIQAVRNDGWTGYEDILSAAGGLFGIGSVDAYLAIKPVS